MGLIDTISDAYNESQFTKGQAFAIDQINLKGRSKEDVLKDSEGKNEHFIRGVKEVIWVMEQK